MKDFDAMVLSVVRDRVRTGRAPRRPIRLVFTADEEAGSGLGGRWLVENHPEVVEGCTEAIGEVGGFSLTVRDDLRLYLVQTAEKGLAWLNLIADGRAGHGSFRNDDNAVTELAAAVGRIGTYEWPNRITASQQAFLEAVSEALGVELDTNDVEPTLAKLGSIARMVGATMGNTANPTMLRAGYKHNVIPGRATASVDGRFVPGGQDAFFETITELLGDKVRYEIENVQPAVETEFSGALVEAMQSCLAAEDPGAKAVPFLMSGGTDAKAWDALGVRCFGFAPLRLPPDLDFVGMFHGVDERVPDRVAGVRCAGAGPVPGPGLSRAETRPTSPRSRSGRGLPSVSMITSYADARPVDYEVQKVRLSRDLSRGAVRQLLTERCEHGGWELTRLRRYRDGSREVWVRRKIIRARLTV